MKTNKALYMAVPVLGMLLGACESDTLLNGEGRQDVPLVFHAPTLAASGEEGGEMPGEAGVYVFSGESLSAQQTINPSDTPEIKVAATDRVYCVAGSALQGLSGVTTLEDFLGKTVASPAGAQSAPMFYTGTGVLDESEGTMRVELTRGVARIDVACADPKIDIRSIVVENAPATSLIIPADHQSDKESATVKYTCNVAADHGELIEQAFTLFESATAVEVRITGLYDGDPMNLLTRIPVVERNKKYTLSISGGSELASSVGISDWQEGETAQGTIDPGETAIDLEASEIPAGVVIDRTSNIIRLPHTGVKDMKIAFRTQRPLELSRRMGDMEKISVRALVPVEKEGAYLSTFVVNVPAQPKCASSYDATFVLSGSTDFFVEMSMELSPYQIPTVFIGGHEWMCFNAVSADIEEQLYLTGDMTVEKMYDEHFAECIGNFFQYGKENPFIPWTSNDPAQFADQTRDIPWQTVGRMPLPQGYHVASLTEWRDLVPNNINIPATYKCATGDSIRATVVTLPGTLETSSQATNAQNYKMRYVLFESLSTGAKLYVPFMGIKTNSKDELPTQAKFRFETRSGYWVKDDRYFMLFDYKTISEGTEGVNIQSNRWNYDGFVGVRGVKD